MNAEYFAVGIIAVGVLFYLFWALINPERL
jgi:K+-transporting ATPase KdpF subunit